MNINPGRLEARMQLIKRMCYRGEQHGRAGVKLGTEREENQVQRMATTEQRRH